MKGPTEIGNTEEAFAEVTAEDVTDKVAETEIIIVLRCYVSIVDKNKSKLYIAKLYLKCFAIKLRRLAYNAW